MVEVSTLGRPALFPESDFSIMEPGSLKANQHIWRNQRSCWQLERPRPISTSPDHLHIGMTLLSHTRLAECDTIVHMHSLGAKEKKCNCLSQMSTCLVCKRSALGWFGSGNKTTRCHRESGTPMPNSLGILVPPQGFWHPPCNRKYGTLTHYSLGNMAPHASKF